MNYTNFALIGLGLLGILLHNLIQMSKINRSTDGNINILKYLRLEIFSIMISVIVVICAVIVKAEITQLEQAKSWLGVAFIAIGYMGQSLLIFVMGKAEKTIGKDNQNQP